MFKTVEVFGEEIGGVENSGGEDGSLLWGIFAVGHAFRG